MKYKVWVQVEAVPDSDAEERNAPGPEGYEPYQSVGEPLEVGVYDTPEAACEVANSVHTEWWDGQQGNKAATALLEKVRMLGWYPHDGNCPEGAQNECEVCAVLNELDEFLEGNRNTPPAQEEPGEADPWREEDASYPREDWRYEVANEDTQLGYWEWVEHRKETDAS